MTPEPGQPASATTAAAIAFVAAHRTQADAAGRGLAELVEDPEAFAAGLDDALRSLADPTYAAGLDRVAPGLVGAIGVRGPLLHGLRASLVRASRRAPSAVLLAVVERIGRSDITEARWLGIELMDRLVLADSERTWQLMRRAAAGAGEWITVDTLASPYARGILREPYRWAEVEQLVYSPSRWERRLAGSSIARMPFVDQRAGREPLVAERGLGVVGLLIGDAAPDVQKALSWALRSLTLVDAAAVTAFCRAEADRAVTTDDGARAWVLRDALEKLAAGDAADLRTSLAGIRRRPNAPSTSEAAATAARYGALPEPASVRITPFP